MRSDLQVAAGRLTTTGTRMLASSLGAGASPAVGPGMGGGVRPRGAVAPGRPSAFGRALGAALLLARLVRAEGQAPAVPEPGGGTRRPPRPGLAGPGRPRGLRARDPGPGPALGPGAGPVRPVPRAVVLGPPRPAVRPGAGQAGPPLRGPWGHPRARQVSPGAGQLAQAGAWRHRRRPAGHGLRCRWLGRSAHP